MQPLAKQPLPFTEDKPDLSAITVDDALKQTLKALGVPVAVRLAKLSQVRHVMTKQGINLKGSVTQLESKAQGEQQ